MRAVIREATGVPVIGVGGITTAEEVDAIIRRALAIRYRKNLGFYRFFIEKLATN